MSENRKKERARKCGFKVYLFPEERVILETKARVARMTKSDLIREFILYGEVRPSNRAIMSDENFKALVYEVSKIGTNVNMIAYNSNLKQSTGREEIELLKKEYYELLALYTEAFLLPIDEEDNEEL
ncbi:MAG: hypothetical protein LUE86_00705 [Clostridiales bacterium]|nr:hypothetical protein [Clostridiales bacterium]